MRIDPADGLAYTYLDFVQHYGPTFGPLEWATAIMIPPAQWFLYYAPRNRHGQFAEYIDTANLQNAPQCRQQKKSKSEKCRQVVTSSSRNPGSPLIIFLHLPIWEMHVCAKKHVLAGAVRAGEDGVRQFDN